MLDACSSLYNAPHACLLHSDGQKSVLHTCLGTPVPWSIDTVCQGEPSNSIYLVTPGINCMTNSHGLIAPCTNAVLVFQADGAAAQGQSFVGHCDSVTALAWVDQDTLISTGPGDAVLIWRLTPAALTACAPPLAPESASKGQSQLTQVPAGISRGDVSQGLAVRDSFSSFPTGEPGAMRHSLETASGQAQNLSAAAAENTATVAVDIDRLHVDAAAPTALITAAADADVNDVMPATQHQLLTGTGIVPPEPAQSIAPPAELHLERVIGFNGQQQGCCVWLPEAGTLVYASEQILILEQLASREQR